MSSAIPSNAKKAPIQTGNPTELTASKDFEEAFHDRWSQEISVEEINVTNVVSSCTAPELRFIFNALGDVRGLRVLDLGCGFGEASVHFARLGAQVTSLDISSGMLQQAQKLAQQNGVQIETIKGDVENFSFEQAPFDIIYVGNALHHAKIPAVLQCVRKSLKANGTFVSWDPLDYNPLIKIYRWLAAEVRTPDEHPITRTDVNYIRQAFSRSEVRFFWFSTLLVFVHMFIMQARSPRKERFWKKVLDEAEQWRPIYSPLERFDSILLTLLPPLRWLCWNVVIVCKDPK